MGIADSAQIVGEWLATSGTSLYTLCGTRVWWPVAQQGWTNTTAALVCHIQEETPHTVADQTDSVMVIKCYGGSAEPDAARAVYRALVARLQNVANVDTATGTIVLAHCINAYQRGVDEGGGDYPSMVTMWRVVTR